MRRVQVDYLQLARTIAHRSRAFGAHLDTLSPSTVCAPGGRAAVADELEGWAVEFTGLEVEMATCPLPPDTRGDVVADAVHLARACHDAAFHLELPLRGDGTTPLDLHALDEAAAIASDCLYRLEVLFEAA